MSSFFRRIIREISGFVAGLRMAIADLPRGLKAFETRANELNARIDAMEAKAKISQRQTLFATVGAALTAWAKMEEVLVIIVSHLLRTQPKKAGVMMYSIHNFASWLSIMNDLFEMDEDLRLFKNRFNKIGERIRRIKDTRDQLAHYSVRMTPKNDPVIRSSRLDARSKSIKQPPLNSQIVVDFTEAALKIAEDLSDLEETMDAALEASRKKSPVTFDASEPESN
jgi:hypothetical protein